eukprot:3498417-Prymnesium_polylepis.2
MWVHITVCCERDFLAVGDPVASRQVQILHVNLQHRSLIRVQTESRALNRSVPPTVAVNAAALVDGVKEETDLGLHPPTGARHKKVCEVNTLCRKRRHRWLKTSFLEVLVHPRQEGFQSFFVLLGRLQTESVCHESAINGKVHREGSAHAHKEHGGQHARGHGIEGPTSQKSKRVAVEQI